MKVVFGLGNIGNTYKDTRHNIGFWIVEKLATLYNAFWKNEHSTCLTSSLLMEDKEVLLVKPTTYMNLSGKAAGYLFKKYNIVLSDLLIVTDDIHLPIGKIRFRIKGSSGGHNGLRSIMSELNTNEFARLKVGVGNPDQPKDLVDFVLGSYTREERIKIEKIVDVSAEALVFALQEGIIGGMNKYNGIEII